MATFSSSDARNRLGELLDRVAQGETITITRRGKAVARIVPEPERSMEKVRQAVDNLRALREQMSKRKGFKPLTDKEIKDSIADSSVAIAWAVLSSSNLASRDSPRHPRFRAQ